MPENNNNGTVKRDIIDAHDYAQDAEANIELDADQKQHLKNTFPPNNKTKVEPEVEDKKKKKVISGKVVQRKKSLGKKILETFIIDDVQSISSYIVKDVLIPTLKDTLYEVVNGTVEIVKGSFEVALFGEKKSSSRSSRDRGRPYVSYNNFSSRDRRDDRRDTSNRNRSSRNFDDIALESKAEALDVLDRLVDLTKDYGQATIADFYDFVGVASNFTDNKYGWEDLSRATVDRTRDGWILNLPKAILLD